MNLSSDKNKNELINWAKSISDFCKNEDANSAKMINDAINSYEADRFILSIMGLAKRGKSTLINALLGRKDDLFAPIDKLPATSVATSFTWGSKRKIEVVLLNGDIKEISAEEIRTYATEEGNPDNVKGVCFIRIMAPFDERLRNVTLVDLPGAGSIHEHHDQIVHQFLPQSDAVLLLTTARMPINEQEVELLRCVRKADIEKIFVAINKRDVSEPEEIAQCAASNRDHLNKIGSSVGCIHQISAKQAFEDNWEGSGVAELWDEISAFLEEKRSEIMKKRLIAKVFEAAGPIAQSLATQAGAMALSVDELKSEKARLVKEKKEIERNRPSQEFIFQKEWNEEIDEIENKLPYIKRKVSDDIASKLEKASVFKVGKLEKELPVYFRDILEKELECPMKEMEANLRKITENFQVVVNRPFYGIDEDMKINKTSSGMIAGTLASGALTAGGIAFATIATMATTVTTVVTPIVGASTLVGALSTTAAVTSVASPLIGEIVGILGSLIPTTTTATVVAPTALAVIAGPIGWSIAALGLSVYPITFGISRRKKKKGLSDQINDSIKEIFNALKHERIPSLRKQAKQVLEEIRMNFNHRLIKIDEALEVAMKHSGDTNQAKAVSQKANNLMQLLEMSKELV